MDAPGLVSVSDHLVFDIEEAGAVIGGRKTQFLRPVKPQPPSEVTSAGTYTGGSNDGEWQWLSGDPKDCDTWGIIGNSFSCPYGKPGDVVYAKEPWRGYDLDGGRFRCEYRADGRCLEVNIDHPNSWLKSLQKAARSYPKWMSPVYMPRCAARLWLHITDAKVMRVQDLYVTAAFLEGCPEDIARPGGDIEAAYFWLREVWDFKNIKKGFAWRKNPWIWMMGFELVDKPSMGVGE